jgi:hypothetical protein
MTTAIASFDPVRAADAAPHSHLAAAEVPVTSLDRLTAEGRFSLLQDAGVRIDGERGLVIRVHAGCLWVPNCDAGCSIGIGAGEDFRVGSDGAITAYGSRGTQVELAWPQRAVGDLH